jgi:hypothetical protein
VDLTISTILRLEHPLFTTIKFCRISSALGCILNKYYKVKYFIN